MVAGSGQLFGGVSGHIGQQEPGGVSIVSSRLSDPRSGTGGSSGAGLAEALDELVAWVGARSFHSQVRLVAGVKRQDVINNGL